MKKAVQIAVAVLIALTAAVLAIYTVRSARATESDFTPEKWRFATLSRMKLVDDLTDNHLHTGMTRGEILAILGSPDVRIEGEGNAKFIYRIELSPIGERFLILHLTDERLSDVETEVR